MQEPKKGIIMQ